MVIWLVIAGAVHGLVEDLFDECLVGDAHFVGCDFDLVNQPHWHADGNWFGGEFEVGELDVDCFGPIYIVSRVYTLPEIVLFLFVFELGYRFKLFVHYNRF